jgi:DNA adenine methylase
MNLKLYDKNNFDEIYRFMATNKIKISLGDFSNILSIAKKGDFVYLDPPYDNLHKKNTFKAYSKENFNQNEQVRLFNFCLKMDEKGVNWLQSNHDTSFIRSLYKKFQIISVNANRSINSDSSKRKNVGELLIKNY